MSVIQVRSPENFSIGHFLLYLFIMYVYVIIRPSFSPPSVSDGSMGFGPSGGGSVPGNHERPFMANVIKKAQKLNAWAVAGVSVSSFVLFLMCIGVPYILLKLKKLARRSSTVGPAVTPPITKRSGKNMGDIFLFFSCPIDLKY